jgi:hypothetical protein
MAACWTSRKLLRHGDIRMTPAIYTHTGAEAQAKALEALPDLDAAGG